MRQLLQASVAGPLVNGATVWMALAAEPMLEPFVICFNSHFLCSELLQGHQLPSSAGTVHAVRMYMCVYRLLEVWWDASVLQLLVLHPAASVSACLHRCWAGWHCIQQPDWCLYKCMRVWMACLPGFAGAWLGLFPAGCQVRTLPRPCRCKAAAL